MKMLEKVAAMAFVAGASVAPAIAQDMRSASEKVVACQSVADSQERLACFEAAARELAATLEARPPVASIENPTAVEQPEIAPSQTAEVQPEQPAESTEMKQASVADPNPTDAPKSSLPSWIPRVTFGSNRDVEKEPDEFQTQITRIQRNRLGRHFFTTSEGHIWKQKKVEEIRAPKSLPADVILYQNITGGLRIKILETNRSYPVNRVE